MNDSKPGRAAATIEALVATFIWASSFVFVKMILPDVGPLTIAGLRYFLGFLFLLPWMIRKRASLHSMTGRTWLHLALIGLSAYTIGNGALFWGLRYVPATTASFLMGVIPLLILFGGVIFLKEIPTRVQVAGVIISLIGNAAFFSSGLQTGELLGVGIVILGMVSFAAFGILGRGLARDGHADTIQLTGIPLAIGGGLLLLIALPLEGVPTLDRRTLFIILWLGLVNTTLAYLMYNHSLKTITALEMNVLENLAPLGTAFFSWVFLGETLTWIESAGMVVVIIGVTLVQLRKGQPR